MSVNRSLIPPGPWGVKGNTVIDGYGQTIAVIFYKHYPLEVARYIAESRSEERLRIALAEIEELKGKVLDLELKNDRLEDEVFDLKDDR